MLPSRKTLQPRSLQSSTSKIILLGQSGTGHRPPFSFYREFTWGSKYKNATTRAGKVCKGFSAQDSTRKILTRKKLYRTVLGGNHHLLSYFPACAPTWDWRFLSSWGKKPERPSSFRNKVEVNEEEEDCYMTLRKRQYDEFMKKIERDPYTALFGKSCLYPGGKDIESRAAKTSSPGSPKEPSVPKNEKSPENWPSKSKTSSTKFLDKEDLGGRQSKNATISILQHDQEYVIDPITNRKVFKTSASPVSTSGPIQPQVKDGEKVFEHIKIASQIPLNNHYVMVKDRQIFSNPDLPGEDFSPHKPHTSKAWLAQEGFAQSQEAEGNSQPLLQTRDSKPKSTATRIESALDRHLASETTNERKNFDRPQLQYKPEENKTEDVDLLRTSDVRALAGLRGIPPKESDADKQARRRKLEESYKSCYQDLKTHLTREAASDKNVQKEEDRSVQKALAPELRFGSWLKGILQDAKLKGTEGLKGTSAIWVNELSDARDSDPIFVHQLSDSTPVSKKEVVSKSLDAGVPEAHNEVKNNVSRLKAQIAPFKAKLDAMKADYDFLRQEWLLEVRRLKEKAAKKEERLKADGVAKRTREIHEEEIRAQKVAMEAIEMRGSDRNNDMVKSTSAKGTRNDDAEKPAPRRLQSFLHGEGDMASNVHEFAGRDRWYKRKAPHALDAKDAEMDAKLQRLTRDRALIREVRDIYEDTYGIIDTKHRQTHIPSLSTLCRPINSSSERTAPQTQPLSSDTSKSGLSEGLNNIQVSEALTIIQKLFGQLRDAQSIIQDYQNQIKGALDPNDQDTNVFKPSTAFDSSIMQILESSMRLGRFRSGDPISPNSVTPSVKHLSSTTALKSTKIEPPKAAQLNAYCILAYEPTTESVKSVKATSLAPLSKEESLLPLDALNRLNNPGKFLPHAISLGAQGYEPVSSTANILVFKKGVTSQNPARTDKADANEKPSPNRDSLDQSSVSLDSSTGHLRWHQPSDPTIEEDVQQIRKMQEKIKEAPDQSLETIEREHQKVEKGGKTGTESLAKEKPPIEGTQQQHSAASSSSNSSPYDTVHRQETVFSGSRQGRWMDNSVRSKRSKRAAGRRRKTMKGMLMAGAFTAACCYGVGVASELVNSW